MNRILVLMIIGACCSACAMSDAAKKKASYHYQMGISYLTENNTTSALVELTEAEKLDPDNPELLNYLGLAYYYKKKYELAEQKYLKSIALKQNYSEARNNLAVNYLEMQRWDDAISQLKIVSEDIFFQNQEVAAVNLGIAFLGKGEYTKALSQLRTATSSYPRNAKAKEKLGEVYYSLNRYDLAIGEYKKAVELYRDYASAYYNLGLAYLKVNETGSARSAFREVVRIAPDAEIGQLSREQLDLLK